MLTDDTRFHDFPDQAFRTLLEDPANLREQVAARLPDLAARLDFERREVLHRNFVLPDWRGREADLIFRVPYHEASERWVFIVLLLEHQSSADPVMPLRMFLTAALFWEREWKAWADRHEPNVPLRLTPVIPLVFHTGRRAWNTNRDIADLIDGPEELQAFAPHWPVLFWDLAEQDIETLLNSTAPWLQALAVVRGEREEPERFRGVLRRLLPRLTDVWERESLRGHGLLHFVLSWAARRRPLSEKAELEQQFRELVKDPRRQKEVLDMVEATWLSADEEWALKVKEAEKRTKTQTLLQERRETLIELLNSRFGNLPRELVQRIESCEDADRLKNALRQVVKIGSINELQL